MPVDVSTNQQASEKIIPLGTKNGLELAICGRTEKTLGKIIAKADSPDLIESVRVEPLQVFPDDRGFFTELARLGKGLASGMVPDKKYSGLFYAYLSRNDQSDSLPFGANRSLGSGFRHAPGFSV